MGFRIPPSMDEADAFVPLEVPRWYAVMAAVRAEKLAELSIGEALRERDTFGDLGVYLPVETVWVKHAGKKERGSRPLLGRYLFVCIRDEHMHVVRDCRGVEDFVRAGGKPRPVNLKRLLELRARVGAGEFDYTREFDGPFAEGDAIEVKLGKLSGWPGRVVKMTSETRVRVLLSMFGKDHEKELDVSELRAA